jgi:hypothetical protein
MSICFYLIFAFWANIFIFDFPFASGCFLVSYLDVWFCVRATCLCKISSADSFSSASWFRSCGPYTGSALQSSFPFVEVGGFVVCWMCCVVF